MIKNNNALVIGAGIAGIKASLELAEMGHKVYLIERNSNIGGKLISLNKQYPTDNCTLCQMLPTFGCDEKEICLRKDLEHENIEIITNAEIEKLKGKAGDFNVLIKKIIGFIDTKKCINCGYCQEVCPVEVETEYGIRKAVFVNYPLAVPNNYIIDEINCTKCSKCVEICPTNAIEFSKKVKDMKINVGAIIVAVGFEEFSPLQLEQYNYLNSPNILTNMDFEKLYSGFGKLKKELLRPSDNKKIEKIAILQCIGSRDKKRNYCSSACCMIALKEAILVKESSPDIDVTIFYMDLRVYGKSYQNYLEKAKNLGIKFINFRVPKIVITKNENLLINYVENGKVKQGNFDLVVLSNGFTAPENNRKLAKILGIELNEHGYFKTSEISGFETKKKGIFVCGTANEPKDITDTIIESIATAMNASFLLVSKIEKNIEKEKEIIDEEPKIGIFICEYGNLIGGRVDLKNLIDYLKYLSNVSFVERIEFSGLAIGKIKNKIDKNNANRIIFASFSPYLFENKLREIKNKIGVLPNLIQLVNFYSFKDWDKDKNTEFAKKQIEIANEKLKIEEELKISKDKAIKRALIIGGGISGMNSALAIANKGFEVDLIEKSDELGGNLKSIFYTIEGLDTQKYLKEIIGKLKKNKLINIYKNTVIEEISGYAGNFETKIKKEGIVKTLKNGAIIIATGGKENKTNEYFYGRDSRIITQTELEKKIVEDKVKAKKIVMIQCVGSREGNNSYCSRICCSTALKNAIKLKEKNKDFEIYILNRDIMSYGFLDEYYKKACEIGINFIRYNLEEKPKVKIKKYIEVEVYDCVLEEKLNIDADLLILSTGIVPNDNLKLAEKLGLQIDDFGFLKVANEKFKPVDFLKHGIFVCGLAHSPRNLKESIVQAYATAGRAVTILSKENLKSRREISEVNERWCVGCELCIEACPYSARILDEEKGVAKTIDVLCQGCGVCAMVCPCGVSKLRGAKDKQILAMVEVAV